LVLIVTLYISHNVETFEFWPIEYRSVGCDKSVKRLIYPRTDFIRLGWPRPHKLHMSDVYWDCARGCRGNDRCIFECERIF